MIDKQNRICISDNGYNDNELALEILRHFDEHTREKAAGRHRRLCLDGFKSHLTLQFLLLAVALKIILVCYPPHCTHALQGLDVVIFASLKREWGKLLRTLHKQNQEVDKHNFLKWYAEVRPNAITTENCISAFRATGIQPFDPSVIDMEQTAPSLATSTQSSGVLDFPTEWLDIRDALRATKNMPEVSISRVDGNNEGLTNAD
jgi:hypothetical protein